MDKQHEVVPQNYPVVQPRRETAEDLAVDFLLSEGRTAAFHARSESKIGKGPVSTTRITADDGTDISFDDTTVKSNGYHWTGFHGDLKSVMKNPNGTIMGTEKMQFDAAFLQAYSIPAIPATLHASMNGSRIYGTSGDRSYSYQCDVPRYSDTTRATCVGELRNGPGELIARQAFTTTKNGAGKMQVYRPDGHYLGEIDEVVYKDPKNQMTTTDVTAHR